MSYDYISQNFISVIIPVFNDSARLKICLDALENQSYPDNLYEVIVIDNGSTEDIQTISNAFKHVSVYLESAPGSYAARNKGIQLARGNLIAFIDSDCIPNNGWIEAGIKQFMDTENCGIVAGRIDLFFKDHLRPTAVELYESIEMGFSQEELLSEQNYALTANLFTSMQVINEIGLFDCSLKSGGDREWGQRVYAAGYEQVYASSALVIHPARHSYWQLFKRVTRINGGNIDAKKELMTPIENAKCILKDLILAFTPPFRSVLNIWFQPSKLTTNFQKYQFTVVMLFVRYISAWERIRLRLGGSSRRW